MKAVDEIKQAIRGKAQELGFDAIGFAAVELDAGAGSDFTRYLEAGYHGDMDWLARRAQWRRVPKLLMPEAKSIIVLGLNYGPGHDPLDILRHPGLGAVSVYAQGRDYHHVAKKKLRLLGRWLAETEDCEIKLFVDTAPVMEKPLAVRAGIGWQGKHTNLVSREFGSWLFLAEIFTTLEIAPDRPEHDHCGSCRRCLEACPTNAFPAPYRIDARRCISYLTIEHKGHIPAEFRAPMANRIYGCDDCLAVCPWNKYAARTEELAFEPRAALTAPRLAELATLDDGQFRRMFSGSAIKRLGRDRFVRNVLIALGNSGDRGQVAVIKARLGDPSPLVRAMAVWALAQLSDGRDFDRLRARYGAEEDDPAVAAEWRARAPVAA